MDQRHRVRQLALQGLCCLDVQGDDALESMNDFISDCSAPVQTIASAREMLSGALGDIDRCNEFLKRHCRHWGLARLALVDRCILRLGVYELLSQQAPPKVVIAESLKLAREFSTAESPRFINGVLDSVVKEMVDGDGDDNNDTDTDTDTDTDEG
ncbi:MAG: transcription antitermination factor NusB [bacterium]|nr:transcription antitermination factor NusB [bacterium]